MLQTCVMCMITAFFTAVILRRKGTVNTLQDWTGIANSLQDWTGIIKSTGLKWTSLQDWTGTGNCLHDENGNQQSKDWNGTARSLQDWSESQQATGLNWYSQQSAGLKWNGIDSNIQDCTGIYTRCPCILMPNRATPLQLMCCCSFHQ